MAFWSDSTVEPKRQFRWLLYLPTDTGASGAAAIQTYLVKTVTKPSWTMTETPVNFMIHTFKYPGRVTWNNVSVTLVDSIDPDTSGILNKIFQSSGYRIPDTEENAIFSFSKSSAINSLGTPRLVQIDAGGNVPGVEAAPREIEEWTMVNAWVNKVQFGSLDYTGDGLSEVQLDISYDYAHYKGDFQRNRKELKSIL
jgi:hypothetical protein